ncbi:MAG TPA: hypothetical protein VHX60_11160 [Acidobacteriaceae bacterium]|jgi:hypothetical protein|nr:hypothetical protein [Acidobacteriaceae bacterium]
MHELLAHLCLNALAICGDLLGGLLEAWGGFIPQRLKRAKAIPGRPRPSNFGLY